MGWHALAGFCRFWQSSSPIWHARLLSLATLIARIDVKLGELRCELRLIEAEATLYLPEVIGTMCRVEHPASP